MVAQITLDIEANIEVAEAARHQRLCDYLQALGQGEDEAPLVARRLEEAIVAEAGQAASLAQLLRMARGRYEAVPVPLATPEPAPLLMPTRKIAPCCRPGLLPALARLSGQSKSH